MKHPGDHRICFIGDSFVQGTSDPDCRGWAGRVSAAACHSGFDVTSHNLGIRGETSRQIGARWKGESAARFQADCIKYVVFSFGANDMTLEDGELRVSVQQSVEHFSRIVSESRANYHTLVVGPPPVGEAAQDARIVRLCTRYAQQAKEIGVPYLALAEMLAHSAFWQKDVVASDGCHPGVAGYRMIAELVGAWPAWWFRADIAG